MTYVFRLEIPVDLDETPEQVTEFIAWELGEYYEGISITFEEAIK